MSNVAPVQLRQVRDLGQNITDTFNFLRQNWKTLYKAIAFVCLPPLILAGVAMSRFFTVAADVQATGELSSPFGFFGGMLVGYILMILVYVLYIAIIYEYVRNYVQGVHTTIGTGALVKQAFGQVLSYFGLFFLSGILIVVGTVLCFLPGIWVAISLCLTPVCHAIERTGSTGSMSRSFELVKGQWWETFGLAIVVYLIMMVITYALMIPLYAVMGIGFFSGFEPGQDPQEAILYMRTVMPLMMMVSLGINMLVYPIGAVSMALRYFTLVESKEHVGLGQQVKGFDTM
jgi:hypothetical protein